MDKPLAGKTVAILVASGFEEVQMTEPQRALLEAGATLKLVSPDQGLVNGWHGVAWGHYFPVDVAISEALAADFDALLVPGGNRGLEKLRENPHAKRLIKGFVDGGKPVAALSHAAILLASGERAQGRTVARVNDTVDALLGAAGATHQDEALVIDRTLLTSVQEPEMDEAKKLIVDLFVNVTGNLAAAA